MKYLWKVRLVLTALLLCKGWWMSFLERFFHATLFEATVVLLSVFALYFFTEESVSVLFGSMMLVSLTAMLWNMIFNYFLDKIFTGPWEKRGVIFRALHAISFEVGLLVFTVPIIAYFLKVDWVTAFMMDFSLTVMITIYTFIFNWVYDHARLLFIKRE